MEEYAIYRDYQKVMDYQDQQRVNQFCRQYDDEDIEGFKLMFPQEEKELEPTNEDLEF